MKQTCFPIADLGIVIAAAGASRRYGNADKLMETLGGMPLFLHAVRAFLPLVPPSRFVIAASRANLETYRNAFALHLPEMAEPRWITGGATRSETVRRALDALDMETGFVAIHDAARPLADTGVLQEVLDAARSCGGALPGRRETDSIKLVDDGRVVTGAADRSLLWRAETPQIFDLARLREAYARGGDATDDVEIARRAGMTVRMVEVSAPNPKLTTGGDLEMIRLLYQLREAAEQYRGKK